MFGLKKSDKPKKPKKLWFKAKSYGWGWTPVSWQGWLVLLIYLFCVAYYAKDVGSRGEPSVENFAYFFVGLFGLSSFLVWICYKKGEKPHWSWGQKKEEDQTKIGQ